MFFRCVLLLCVLLAGCQHGHKPNPEFRLVKGTLTFNGVPVEGATVAFSPTDDRGVTAGGTTDASGNYRLTADGSLVVGAGTKPGTYNVTVKKLDFGIDQDQSDYEAGKITQEELENRQRTRKVPPPKNFLPEIYADKETTPLEVTVENKKENVLDLQIEGK